MTANVSVTHKFSPNLLLKHIAVGLLPGLASENMLSPPRKCFPAAFSKNMFLTLMEDEIS
jgi:hypothetical protein